MLISALFIVFKKSTDTAITISSFITLVGILAYNIGYILTSEFGIQKASNENGKIKSVIAISIELFIIGVIYFLTRILIEKI